MATDGLPAERLRTFVRGLAPAAQSQLVTELERSVLRGVEIPGASLILDELRPALREMKAPPERVVTPARLFFRPLEPFLVDPRAVRSLAGRIERTSIDPLWDWICDGLMPAQAKVYVDRITAALLAQNEAEAREQTRAFQDDAAGAMRATLDRAAADDRFGRRLVARVRTERVLEEIETLCIVLTHQHALARIAARLPSHFRNFGDDQADSVINLLSTNLAGRGAAVQAALILVAARLETPSQLLRIAIRSAEDDSAARVAQSRYALAVDMVLADLRGAIETMRGLCRAGLFADALVPLKDIHDTVRIVRTELNLTPDSVWGRELSAIRTSVSDLLRVELESTSGWVRRLLRPRSAREAPSALDPDEVTEVEGRIGLVAACRHYAGELAINQLAPRVFAELQSYLDGSLPTLIESLRGAEGADRRFRQSQVDAGVRFAGKVFGAQYAALLAKAVTMALAEQKPARA